jgi:hypothetical protein
MEFLCGTTSISYLIKLYFHPYVDHKKQSPYVTWASVLVYATPGAQDRLELDLDWAPNLAWTPLLGS